MRTDENSLQEVNIVFVLAVERFRRKGNSPGKLLSAVNGDHIMLFD